MTSPSLHVIARPQLDEEAIEAFLAQEGLAWRRTPQSQPSEDLVELAGRVCYLSFGERQSHRSTGEYVANLIAHGHESVLEHAAWTFMLTGVSRAFSHQLVRHRIGFSYSQLSQQYHDESAATAIIPDVIRRHPQAADVWQRTVADSFDVYRELLRLILAEESRLPQNERLREVRTAARSVLPAAVETKIVITANCRAIRHFLSERGSVLGDEEMRVVSVLWLRTMLREAPSLFADFETSEAVDGLPIVKRRRPDGSRPAASGEA